MIIDENPIPHRLSKRARRVADNALRTKSAEQVRPDDLAPAEVFSLLQGNQQVLEAFRDDEQQLFERLLGAQDGFRLHLHASVPDDWTFIWSNAKREPQALELVERLARAFHRIGLERVGATLLATIAMHSWNKEVIRAKTLECATWLRPAASILLPLSTGMLLASHFSCSCLSSKGPEGGPSSLVNLPPSLPGLTKAQPNAHPLLADCATSTALQKRIVEITAAFMKCCDEGRRNEAQLLLDRLYSLQASHTNGKAELAYLRCTRYLTRLETAAALQERTLLLEQAGIKLRCSLQHEVVFERQSTEPISRSEHRLITSFIASVLANPHADATAGAYLRWLSEVLGIRPDERASFRQMLLNHAEFNPKQAKLAFLLIAKHFGEAAVAGAEREELVVLVLALDLHSDLGIVEEGIELICTNLPQASGDDLRCHLLARMIRDGRLAPGQELQLLGELLLANRTALPTTVGEVSLYCDLLHVVLRQEAKSRDNAMQAYVRFLDRLVDACSPVLRSQMHLTQEPRSLGSLSLFLAQTMNEPAEELDDEERVVLPYDHGLFESDSPQRHLVKEFLVCFLQQRFQPASDEHAVKFAIRILDRLNVPSGLDKPMFKVLEAMAAIPPMPQIDESFFDQLEFLGSGRAASFKLLHAFTNRSVFAESYEGPSCFLSILAAKWPSSHARDLQLAAQMALARGAFAAATDCALALAEMVVECANRFPDLDSAHRHWEDDMVTWSDVCRAMVGSVIVPLRACEARGSDELLSDEDLARLEKSLVRL